MHRNGLLVLDKDKQACTPTPATSRSALFTQITLLYDDENTTTTSTNCSTVSALDSDSETILSLHTDPDSDSDTNTTKTSNNLSATEHTQIVQKKYVTLVNPDKTMNFATQPSHISDPNSVDPLIELRFNHFLETLSRFKCKYCGTPIASLDDLITIDSDSATSTQDFSLGISNTRSITVHSLEITTGQYVKILTIRECFKSVGRNFSPTISNSFFKGFCWKHLWCIRCRIHLGWKYIRLPKWLRKNEPSSQIPISSFYALRICKLSLA